MTLFANLCIPAEAVGLPEAIVALDECQNTNQVVLIDVEGGWFRRAYGSLEAIPAGSNVFHKSYLCGLLKGLKDNHKVLRLVCDGAYDAAQCLSEKNIVAAAVLSVESGVVLVDGKSVRDWRKVICSELGMVQIDDFRKFIEGPLGTFSLAPAGNHLIYTDRNTTFIRGRFGKNYVEPLEWLFLRWIELNASKNLKLDFFRISDSYEGDRHESVRKFFAEVCSKLRKGQQLTVRIFQWDKANVHSRLLVNQATGINFDFGLNATSQGKLDQADVLMRASWVSRNRQYGEQPDSGASYVEVFENS